MSARHRHHKQKIAAAKQALADREADFVAYGRVIDDMMRGPLPPVLGTQALHLVTVCRGMTASDVGRMRKAVVDLERTPPA